MTKRTTWWTRIFTLLLAEIDGTVGKSNIWAETDGRVRQNVRHGDTPKCAVCYVTKDIRVKEIRRGSTREIWLGNY